MAVARILKFRSGSILRDIEHSGVKKVGSLCSDDRIIWLVLRTQTPQLPADYRPISVTPVLTRITERIAAQRYIYPALTSPPPTLHFADQFASRPTGSTTAAIISLLNSVTNLLDTEPYVIVISLDFSKALDTLRHSTLLHKLAQLQLPDHIYNWLNDFFSNQMLHNAHKQSFSR